MVSYKMEVVIPIFSKLICLINPELVKKKCFYPLLQLQNSFTTITLADNLNLQYDFANIDLWNNVTLKGSSKHDNKKNARIFLFTT